MFWNTHWLGDSWRWVLGGTQVHDLVQALDLMIEDVVIENVLIDDVVVDNVLIYDGVIGE